MVVGVDVVVVVEDDVVEKVVDLVVVLVVVDGLAVVGVAGWRTKEFSKKATLFTIFRVAHKIDFTDDP